jgi:hypothetical protein
MAQQQQGSSEREQRQTPAPKGRGTSNSVIVGTILVLGVLVFSFLFFGDWDFFGPGAYEEAVETAPPADDGASGEAGMAEGGAATGD